QIEPEARACQAAEDWSRCGRQRDGRLRMAWQSRHAGVQGTARSREVDRIVLPERRLYDRFRRGSAVLPQGHSRQIPVTDESEPSSAPGAEFRGSAPISLFSALISNIFISTYASTYGQS